MSPGIESFPLRFVVGIGGQFISVLSPQHDNHIVIPRLWGQFGGRVKEVPNRKDSLVLGCVWCLDLEGEDDPGRCFYMACTEVTAVDDVPEGMISREIPAGRYAVFTHKGGAETLGETMGYIHGVWYPTSGYQRRDAPEIEIYSPSCDEELHIGVPIV